MEEQNIMNLHLGKALVQNLDSLGSYSLLLLKTGILQVQMKNIKQTLEEFFSLLAAI